MQYEGFEQPGLPCGSGSVESAIRRVINLRLKALGTFWTPAMAECVLFLRAQLLSGRGEVMLGDLAFGRGGVPGGGVPGCGRVGYARVGVICRGGCVVEGLVSARGRE